MKFLLLFAVSALSCGIAMGQKCKFTIDKTDPFTNEKVNTIIRSLDGFYWNSSRIGARYQIEVSFNMAGESRPSMTVKDSMMVKLVDGTILIMKPEIDAAPMNGSISQSTGRVSNTSTYANRVNTVTKTTSYSTFKPLFKVTKEVFEKLAYSPITIIRFDFAGEPMDFNFDKKPLLKMAPDIQHDATCIVQLP